MWTILYVFPVKQKFGDSNKDSEVFVVAPSTAPLNPVLVDRFSDQVRLKKNSSPKDYILYPAQGIIHWYSTVLSY